MTAVLLGNEPVHSEAWHALRAGGIGGSEIAAVVGLSKWTSPYQLFHRKRGAIAPQQVSEPMEWGTRLEPVIAAKFAEEHPEFDVAATPGTYAHPDNDWQRCNPDGVIFHETDDESEPDYLLEVKTVGAFADDFTKDSVPVYYACQVQWELDIFGLDRCYAAVLIGGNTYREYVIEANPDDQAFLREAAAKFWAAIQSGEEPPLDASDHTYRTVVELNPDMEKGEFVNLAPDAWAAYLSAKADLDKAEGDLTLAKSQILTAMRGVQYARYAGENVLRRQRSASGSYYLRETA